MRVCVLTNGNYFAQTILRRLFVERHDEICGVILSTKIYGSRGKVGALRAVWRRVGPGYFWYKSLTYAAFMAAGALFRRTPFFVSQLAARYGVPVIAAEDVNAPETVDQVSAWQPDVLLSVSCNQRVGPELLAAARQIALNVHSSLLPRYAGLAPYVWVLANGESETGVTIHEMAAEFDTGAIVTQEAIPIAQRDTVFSLFLRCCERAMVLIPEAIAAVERGTVRLRPQRIEDYAYCSWPGREAARRLTARGRKWVTLGDLVRAVRLARAERPWEGEATAHRALKAPDGG